MFVNGVIETRKRKKIFPDDIVEFEGEQVTVVSEIKKGLRCKVYGKSKDEHQIPYIEIPGF